MIYVVEFISDDGDVQTAPWDMGLEGAMLHALSLVQDRAARSAKVMDSRGEVIFELPTPG